MSVKKTYSEKLKHPKWQKKRLEILNRDNFTCQYCKDAETELQIHHLEYNGEPWNVSSDKLITLCKNCHEIESTCGKIVKAELIAFVKVYRLKDSLFILDYKTNEVIVRFNPKSPILNRLYHLSDLKNGGNHG